MAFAVGVASFALLPGPFVPGIWDLGPIEDALGVRVAEPALRLINGTSRVLISVLYAAAVWSLLRLRRSHGVERQQIKWVAYAVVMLIGRSDAATAITSFSSRLRDEIELDSLSPELLAVVEQTM